MLFLYRPRQTYMPFARPRSHTAQAAYNRQLQEKFDSTRRVQPAIPVAAAPQPAPPNPTAELKDLAAMHESGALTDAEFAAAKARLLGT
jgi:hypothetical protein